MRLRRARALFAALMALSPALAAEAGVVRGRVLTKGTDKPIEGARAFTAGSSRMVATDSLGHFILNDVPAGLVTIRVNAPWHEMWSGSVGMGGATDTQKVEVRLSRIPTPGMVSGLVTAEHGAKPARHAHVRVQGAAKVTEATADEDGLFSLFGVALGPQTIIVTAMGYDPVSVPVVAEEARNWTVKVDLGESLLNEKRKATAAPVPHDTVGSVRFTVIDTATVRTRASARVRPVRVEILDGERVVRTLVDWKTLPGDYTSPWDGLDDAGKPVAAGTYRYRVLVDAQPATEGTIVKKQGS